MTNDSSHEGGLSVLARFSNRTFRPRKKEVNKDKPCTIQIDIIRNGPKMQQDSARKRYDRVGISFCKRTYANPLLQAVDDQDYDRFESLIDGNCDVSVLDNETGSTALHLAAKHENSLILHMLIEKGADCNAQDYVNHTPLHHAVKKDRFDNCKILLDQSDLLINETTNTQDTALHIAAKEGRFEICNMILKHADVQVNLKNKKGITPLHYAAQENHQNLLQSLLNASADWTSKDSASYIPLHYAALRGYPLCCEILMAHVNEADREKQLRTCLKDGKTPLMLAAKQGHHKCCILMECQNINAKDKENNTALHLAVSNGFEITVETLLSMGADPRIPNKKNIAPILTAASKKKLGCFKFLLDNNADINVFDNQGRGVLHYAAEKNALDTMTFILDSVRRTMKELIDKMDVHGSTALHTAIKREAPDCAVLLLKNEASPTLECAGRMTPLHLAADKGYTSVCEILLSNNAVNVSQENEKKATPLHMAALHGSADVCKMLIRKGARVTAIDSHGRNALHVAASEGSTNAVKLLTKKGISLKVKDDTGSTALHLAASKGSIECCKALVKSAKGCCWESDHNGKLPLDRAFKDSQSNSLKSLSIEDHDLTFSYLLTNTSYKEDNHELILRIHSYMDTAILQKRPIVIDAIASSSWWSAGISAGHGYQCQNFRKLISMYPEFAIKFMDNCVTRSGEENNIVTYDFRLYEDNYYVDSGIHGFGKNPFDSDTHKLKSDIYMHIADSLEWKTNHPLSLMIQHQNLKMLQHPLTHMWLLQRWKSYIFLLFLLALLIDCLFTGFLTLFMGTVYNWTDIKEEYNETQGEFCSISNATSKYIEHLPVTRSVWIGLLILSLVIIAKELYFMWRLKKHYINYIEHSIHILRILFTMASFIQTNACEFKYYILNIHSWQLGIIALLLTWLHLINTLNQLPKFSIFMPVTRKFLKSFFKVIAYIGMIVFVFAFIFHLLLRNQKAFRTLPEAILKTSMWMLQDLAYDNTFVFNKEILLYPFMIRLFFLVFVAFLGGFIVNFIITQPSNQLESFREKACFHRAANRAELFFKYDICFPNLRRVNTKAKMIDDEAKDDDESITWAKKLLALNSKDQIKPQSQMDLIQSEIEKLAKQTETSVALRKDQVEEVVDLKQQIEKQSKHIEFLLALQSKQVEEMGELKRQIATIHDKVNSENL